MTTKANIAKKMQKTGAVKNVKTDISEADLDLINLFLTKKDDYYFEQPYDNYSNLVFRKCLSYLENQKDADDTFQKIWTKVYFKLKTFKGNSKFSTWLYKITVNECINHLKARKRIFEFDETNIRFSKQENHYKKEEIKQDVTKSLNELSKHDRTIIKLKYVEEFKYEEISELTGLTVSALKMRVSRIKTKLSSSESLKGYKDGF